MIIITAVISELIHEGFEHGSLHKWLGTVLSLEPDTITPVLPTNSSTAVLEANYRNCLYEPDPISR